MKRYSIITPIYNKLIKKYTQIKRERDERILYPLREPFIKELESYFRKDTSIISTTVLQEELCRI